MSPSPTAEPRSPSLSAATDRSHSPSTTSTLSRVRNLVISGQLEPLEALLDSMPNFFIDAILKAGWTALMYAAYRGHPHLLRLCLERGADPNYQKGK